MKSLSILPKLMVALLLVVLATGITRANTFTAIASGNYSSSATWAGGTAPANNITGADAIVIGSGFTVNLDNSVTINNASATFTVAAGGSVTGSSTGITVTNGTLSGSGTINIDSLTIGTSGSLTTTGGVTAVTFCNMQSGFNLTTGVQVTGSLVLGTGNLQLGVGGLITLSNNGTINYAGGTYSVLGGSLNLGSAVNLLYSGTASGINTSLGLTGVNNVTVNLSSSSGQISLGSDLNIAGSLNLQSGQVNTNGYNINVGGNITTLGSGTINSTSATNITIGGASNSSLSFTAAGNTVNNLTIASGLGVSGSVSLNSNLTVSGALALNSGSLNIGSSTLTIGGSVSGAGTLSGNSSSGLVLNGSGAGSQGTISFSGSGNTIGTLTINNSGLSGSTTLGSNLTVAGSLNLTSGTFNLGSSTLTLGGTVTGSGNLSSTSSAGLVLTGNGSQGTLNFSSNGNVIGNLTINNSGSNGSTTLGSNLTVNGTLALTNGNLSLGSSTLTVGGTITGSGSGTLSGTSSSGLVISGNGQGNLGTIYFAGSGNNTLGSLTVNASGSNGSATLGSNLSVTGNVNLTGGTFNLGSSTLTVGGSISGSGTFSGTATSGLVLNGSGSGSQGTLTFSSGGNTIGNLTINNTGTNGSTTLGSNLTVSGALNLTGGTFNSNGNTLTLGGTVTSTGSGSLGGNSSTNINITGAGNIGLLVFSSDSVINNLTINATGSGAYINLGSNVNIAGTLTLTNGNIQTGNYNITLTGTTSASGGSGISYVATTGSGSLIANVGAGGSAMFQVGDSAYYAPVSVTNNSSVAGNFMVNAHAGIYASGTSGIDLSATQNSVNTSWNVESDITTGANVALTAYWSAGMAVNGFNNTQGYLSHYTNGAWDESASTSLTATGSGMFSVSRTGITSFSPFAVFGTNATGIAQVTQEPAGFSLYPNPAQNTITLALQTNKTDQQARIFDAIGNQVMVYPVNNLVSTIDISHLSAGVYFITLNDKYTSRFVKQ